jgi:glutamate dehydrogenase (NAD(P)+)
MSPKPTLEIQWTDEVTGRSGFVVIDRLVRGVASGGLRMREGCTIEEVRGLAAGMTLKEALHYDPDARYIPLGGAKGGIDLSPYDPQARGVLTRFLEAVRPIVETYWTTGEDLGISQDLIDTVVQEIGMRSSIQAVYSLLDDERDSIDRLARAFRVEVDGLGLDELVGGLGVAEAALTTLDHHGVPYEGTRAVVQGFGSMGGATARYLAQAGVRVVGLADAHGVVANPDGLDVETLLLTRDTYGGIDRKRLRPDDVQLPLEEWLKVPAELLVPAAVSYCIDATNVHEVVARFVVEAANLPVLPKAEAELHGRGVVVVPDFVANSATNAWWWWTLFGDAEPTAESAFAKVRGAIRARTQEMLKRADDEDTTPREAAMAMATDNLRLIEQTYRRST